MAVSSTSDYSMTGADFVEAAREHLGVHADEEPLEAHELQKGLRSLNKMLKTWQVKFDTSWLLTEGSLTLVDGQESYSFASGGDFTTVPYEMMDIRISRSGNDLQMTEISREEYFALPLKTNKGYPTQWYYDRQRDDGTLYVWPAPDASAGTLKFTYERRILDIDVQADNLDVPQEWMEAVEWNLAARLMTRYPVAPDRGSLVLAAAQKEYDDLVSADVARGMGSVTIRPDVHA